MLYKNTIQRFVLHARILKDIEAALSKTVGAAFFMRRYAWQSAAADVKQILSGTAHRFAQHLRTYAGCLMHHIIQIML